VTRAPGFSTPLLALFVLLVLASFVPSAQAQIDPVASTVTAPGGGAGRALLRPDGFGDALGAVGSELIVRVIDVFGVPVTGLTADDFEVDGGPPALMTDGRFLASATGPYDVRSITVAGPGTYVIDGPLFALGCGDRMIVKVRGLVLNGGAPVANPYNSADINNDAVVNLADIGAFAAIFSSGAYNPCADLSFDGTVNIADVGALAAALGAAWPLGYGPDPVD